MKCSPFPDKVYAHGVDTDGVHAFGTPLYDEKQIEQRVEVYTGKPGVTEVRVATYRLESVRVV